MRMIEDIKVRLNETGDHNHRCWLDAGSTYYYGRSPETDLANPKIDEIEEWLDKVEANYKKYKVIGCLPEWKIEFKTPKDLTMFKIKYVDNS